MKRLSNLFLFDIIGRMSDEAKWSSGCGATIPADKIQNIIDHAIDSYKRLSKPDNLTMRLVWGYSSGPGFFFAYHNECDKQRAQSRVDRVRNIRTLNDDKRKTHLCIGRPPGMDGGTYRRGRR